MHKIEVGKTRSVSLVSPTRASNVQEVVRSGTWSTIRYAARAEVNLPLVIIWPDGTMKSVACPSAGQHDAIICENRHSLSRRISREYTMVAES